MSEPHVEKQPPVPPFVQFCCAAIPQVFDDSLSYYEALCAMWKYLDETRQVVNNNATITEEQLAAYEALHEYVEHYFDNLDVQTEINNKLDAMAEDGTLGELMGTYIDPVLEDFQETVNGTITDFETDTNATLSSFQSQINSLASGSPAGVYATKTALATADPDHSKTYIVTADGKWYYYDTGTSDWVAGGLYQSANALAYRGNIVELGYTTMAACVEDGYYSVKTSDLASITDKPSEATAGGWLEVFAHSPSNVVNQIYHDNNGNSYQRYGNNAFKKLNYYQKRIGNAGSVDILDLRRGYYNVYGTDVSNLTNAPSGLSSACNIYVVSPAGGNITFFYISDINGHTWFRRSGTDTWKLITQPITATPTLLNWCSMGDSIPQGWYSFMDGDEPTSDVDSTKAWTTKVATINNWNITHIEKGGTGYLHVRDSHPSDKNAFTLAAETDYSSYDLVTLAYGINDWKGNQVVGSYTDSTSGTPTTVCGAMKKTIETIMTSNPNCKIVVILPLNAWGYSFNYGDKTTNYGLGYTFSNSGTLESFVQKLIEVCDYYGIEYVDQTHYSVVNRENLPSILIDGVHPSETGHTLLAYELAKKISG